MSTEMLREYARSMHKAQKEGKRAPRSAAESIPFDAIEESGLMHFGGGRYSILDMINEGILLLDIYDSTCVTKKMLTETAYDGFMGPEFNQNYDRWKLVPMEIALIGISNVIYTLNEGKVDILVKQDNKDVLAIITVKSVTMCQHHILLK